MRWFWLRHCLIDPAAGTESVLYSFCGQQNCTDGAQPGSSLIDIDGTLYGTTEAGGNESCQQAFGCGTVFSIDENNGTETVLYSFCTQQNCTDGQSPSSSLIDVDGTLYGTTYVGGAFDGGTLFSLNLNTGTQAVGYSFCAQKRCKDGSNP